MTRRYKTVTGTKGHIQAYMKRANQLWRYATDAFHNGDFDACAINAIHSCISLADAACITVKGTRYAGTSHDEAVQYFHDLGLSDEGFSRARRRLGQIVGIKSAAEYGGSNLTRKDVDTIYKNGERFRDYLFKDLLKEY